MNTRALLLFSLLPLAAAAQPVTLRSSDSSELGFEIGSQRYEAGAGSTAYSQDGNKVGIAGRFTQALADDWYWGADARHAFGSVNYSSTSRGNKGGNDEVLTEVRITGGKDYPFGHQLLAPYFGLGYRELSTDLRGLTSTGDEGYRRRSQYVYLPLGLTHRLSLGAQARLSTSFEYDLLLDGRQRYLLSDTDPASNDPATSQRRGHGLRLTSSYETWHWSVGFFAHYWRIGVSDEARGGVPPAQIVEPTNNNVEMGLQFRLRFN